VLLIGTIVRLQVQETSLKVGQAPRRRYDPSPLRVVPELTLTPRGVVGQPEQGEAIVDVHHEDHRVSKNRGGQNGVSLGFTSHYAAMRDRFGDHLVDGIAGENILIETAGLIGEAELARGVLIETNRGERAELQRIVVAAPCVEFGRYALRFPEGVRPDETVTEALRYLHDGMRGFYASYAGESAALRVGDRVLAA
jgi:hypothetical protein